MEASEIRQMTDDALAAKARELREEIHASAFGAYQRKEKNVKRRSDLRRDLARVLTILSERAKTRASTGTP